VTEQCNLSCRYCKTVEDACKNADGELLSDDEIITAVEAAASLGITKLRITGGEPLLRRSIVSVCRRASQVPGIREICLTTNGTLLPELARPLREAGVSRVNISLDTLNPNKYHFITHCDRFQKTIDGIRTALDTGFEKVKLNSVLIKGFNDDEIRDLAELTMSYPLDVRFIELMPMDSSESFRPESFIPCSAVLDRLPDLEAVEPDGGVAKLYRLPGSMGHVGLISPLSAHFCASCNRIRLTADGKIKPCLHSPEEYSVKGLDYGGVVAALRQSILCKPPWHGVLDARNRSRAGRSMNRIGG
jgi:cyclic pyranopterin phosphate synthase